MTTLNLPDGTALVVDTEYVDTDPAWLRTPYGQTRTPVSRTITWHHASDPHRGVVTDRITHRVAAALLEYHGIPDAWDDHFQYGPYRPPQPTTT